MQTKRTRYRRETGQSAMEYLMTYGWAILIIAIVLVAFFSLNLFNPYTFAPKASPGSCQILRPNGPGSNLFVSAVGPTCTTNQIPQYVAQFNGGSEYVDVQPLAWTSPSYTLSAWVNINSVAGQASNQSIVYEYGLSNGGCIKNIEVYNGIFEAGYFQLPAIHGFSVATGTWYFLTLTYNAGTSTEHFYIDNISQGISNGIVTFPAEGGSLGPPYQVRLGGITAGVNGCWPAGGYWQSMDGKLSNVQFYNTSLSSNDIKALYAEGIGGVPIDLQHLVGWWPLNGNSNDYSGNGNNGVPTNVVFTSSWENGYSSP